MCNPGQIKKGDCVELVTNIHTTVNDETGKESRDGEC